MESKNCPECGVPELISSENTWMNNGDIVNARERGHRMVFIETENLDPLFEGIAEIVGSPIEKLIIAAGRRAYKAYLGAFVDEETKAKIRNKEIQYVPIMESFFDLGKFFGVGNYVLLDLRYRRDAKDYNTVRISEPYSIPMNVAAHIGDIELLTGVDYGHTYVQVTPANVNIHVFPSPHPKELKKRMWTTPYVHKDGDLELDRCETCAGPKLLGGSNWFLRRGVIANRNTRRRMAVLSDALLDPVFEELESELGDSIPHAVVEAQRRFTTSGFYTVEDILSEADFRTQIALRGLGNLKELDVKMKRMRVRMENVALPLLVVGQAQGFFEMQFDLEDTSVDWEVSGEGDLEMEVRPVVQRAPTMKHPLVQESTTPDLELD